MFVFPVKELLPPDRQMNLKVRRLPCGSLRTPAGMVIILAEHVLVDDVLNQFLFAADFRVGDFHADFCNILK